MSILNRIDNIPIKIASPEKIMEEWSFGEVKKPETINYRTHKPEKGGLFCERIFGPIKDNQCSSHCGHYKQDIHIGKVCPRCGVEVAESRVRRERFGHIKLEAPVAHFWFFRGKSRYISALLDIGKEALERVIYCDNRIVTDPGDTDLVFMQRLTEAEYLKALDTYSEENGYSVGFKAGIGAKVIRELLENLDLVALEAELKEKLQTERSKANRENAEKRLKVVQSFLRSGNKPEWMIFLALPVLPPELRPMVQIDGGRFASSDLNDLYRRVINRNSRLKRLNAMGAPNVVIENEMRMLQEAVDGLISNSKTHRPVTGPGNKPLKSLEDSIKGKGGRFRQNLLGKRVDYSGRSVIISGPELRMHQVGIPRKMAIELFKPIVIYQLIKQNKAINAKQAINKILKGESDVWEILKSVTKNHPVLLNRAPSLHRLSIQAFEPVIVEGSAIKLHPLSTSAFNADFDGDQMAVHVPLSREAQLEARLLLFSTENLIHPQNGKAVKTPSQDMVLGLHYLSIEKNGEKGEGSYFSSPEEVISAYDLGWVSLHSKIVMDIRDSNKIKGYKYIVTTPGKVIFNHSMPNSLQYLNDSSLQDIPEGVFNNIEEAAAYIPVKRNKPFDKKFLGNIIDYAFDHIEKDDLVLLHDAMMDLGFKYAMRGGMTISLFDVHTPEVKDELVEVATKKVDEVKKLYVKGFITNEFRYKKSVQIWGDLSENVANIAYEELMQNPENPIAMMIGSGARGSNSQYRQLAAMRGLMADPAGKTIEKPILSNFSQGLKVNEYFISTHGSRKGMVDTALKTANSGYLTRRMVDVSQDVVITEYDCGTDESYPARSIEPNVMSLEERLIGRFLAEPFIDEETGEILVTNDSPITKAEAKFLASLTDEVRIRNVTICESELGVCQKCYGTDLATRKLVYVGQPVGVIAAQSIGEPGTQLTMRTFHTGGVAGEGDITQGLPRIEEILEARKLNGPKDKKAVLTEIDGYIKIQEKGVLKEVIVEPKNPTEDNPVKVYSIPYGYGLNVSDGDYVLAGTTLTTGSASPHEILKIKDIETVRRYLIDEVQKVYKSQGVPISDKHIEIIVRQMTKRVVVKFPGDSDLLIGKLVDRARIKKLNRSLIAEGKQPIVFNERVQGIKEAALSVDSFLSASSFERTSEILSDAAIKGKVDKIRGLKESVIVGKLIPAGTGFKANRAVKIQGTEPKKQ